MNDVERRFEELSLSLRKRPTSLVFVESLAYFSIMLTALVCNVYLCRAFYKTRALRNIQNYYLISLAITDILYAALCMPFTLAVLITGDWPFGDVSCQFQACLTVMLTSTSTTTIATVAVNRYIKIVKSSSLYNKVFSKRNVLISIFMWWIIPFVFAVSAFALTDKVFRFHPGKCKCFQRTHIRSLRIYITCNIVAMVLLSFPAVAVSYYNVYKKVRAHFNQVAQSVLQDENSRAFAEETKITNMLLVTSCAFFFCWTPSVIILLLETYQGLYRLPREVYMFNTFAVSLSSAVNPFIYGLMRKEFKRAYIDTLPCRRR